MIAHVTNDECIFVSNDELLQQFKNLADLFEEQLNKDIPKYLKEENIYGHLYNTWLALLPDSRRIFFDETKRFSHAFLFYCIQQVSKHKRTQQFIQFLNNDSEKQFVFTFYLTIEALLWTETVISRVQEDEDLTYCDLKMTIKHTFCDVEDTRFSTTLLFQKKILQAMIQSQQEDELSRHIANAVQRTNEFYEDKT